MVNWKLGIKRKNKMLPQQYYRATTLIQNLGWISRGDSSNLYGGKMWFVTPKGRAAYCHALSVSNETGPKWNCPKLEPQDADILTKQEMKEFWEYHHDGIKVGGLLERMFIVLGDTFKGKLKVCNSEF